MAGVVIAMGIVWRYRKTKRIRHIGLPYLIVLAVGQLCVLLAIHSWLGEPSTFKCVLEDQLTNFGQIMILSSIAVKGYRVMRVYDNRVLAKSINRNSLLGLIGVNPLIQLALIVIAESLAPGVPTLKLEKGVARFKCVRSVQPLGSILDLCNFGAVLLLFVVTTILLYKVRRVQTPILRSHTSACRSNILELRWSL
ncbi:7 transmembrane sweet-taste receptor of 3 GCPR-domain-containing protein [Catenaria anguillulae PL171]|uniref:7 transmembrane sweet-taste receptor of 3 GCPR-domain-containing protein n=1 Tax=Catenaria anguillulae PL171 TaxID=765915 RepID=A0A1Y2HP35_9FUNG|nr:7 transmembrane sweet-taste receptor of 3 GCPR-domain-containing protein [Catenaria anguillulae PL171]